MLKCTLTLTGAQNAINLLAEPVQRFEKRKELVAKKDALVQGLEMLQELQQKYSDIPGFPSSQATFESSVSPPSTDEMEKTTRSRIVRR